MDMTVVLKCLLARWLVGPYSIYPWAPRFTELILYCERFTEPHFDEDNKGVSPGCTKRFDDISKWLSNTQVCGEGMGGYSG